MDPARHIRFSSVVYSPYRYFVDVPLHLRTQLAINLLAWNLLCEKISVDVVAMAI